MNINIYWRRPRKLKLLIFERQLLTASLFKNTNMKKILLIALIILFSKSIYSQHNTFIKIPIESSDNWSVNLIENEDNIYLATSVLEINSIANYFIIYKLTKSGQVLDSLIINTHYANSIYNGCLYLDFFNNNIRLIISQEDKDNNYTDILLFTININSFTIEYEKTLFTVENMYGIQKPFKNKNNNIVFYGYIKASYIFIGFIVEVDNNGLLINEKYFPPSNFFIPLRLAQLKNSTYYYYVETGDYYMEVFTNSCILHLDSSFNTIKILKSYGLSIYPDLTEVNNSIFISGDIRYMYSTFPITPHDKGYSIIKMDDNYEPLKIFCPYKAPFDASITGEMIYPCILGKSNLLLSDSNYFYLGGQFMDFDNQVSWIHIHKLDTMLNEIWEKKIGGDLFYRAWYMSLTEDDKCYIYTTVGHRPNRYTVIFKLDADGNIISNIKIPMQANSINIYPNPFTSSINGNLPEHGIANITLVNTMGIALITEQVQGSTFSINTQNLPAGFYFLKLQQGGKMYNYKLVKE